MYVFIQHGTTFNPGNTVSSYLFADDYYGSYTIIYSGRINFRNIGDS